MSTDITGELEIAIQQRIPLLRIMPEGRGGYYLDTEGHILPLSDQFSGPIAIAWTKEDPVALAKVLYDFSRKTKLLDFKSAIIAGQVLDADKFKQFSKLPGRDELLTQLVYVISSPMRGLVIALNEINAGFVRVLADIKNKKEKEN